MYMILNCMGHLTGCGLSMGTDLFPFFLFLFTSRIHKLFIFKFKTLDDFLVCSAWKS